MILIVKQMWLTWAEDPTWASVAVHQYRHGLIKAKDPR